MRRRLAIALTAGMLTFAMAAAATPPPAQALDLTNPICSLAGLLSKVAGTVCVVARKGSKVLQAGKKLLGGHLGGAMETLAGAGTAVKALTATAVLASIVGWVTAGARTVLGATAHVISATTRPQLQSTWFSASYWRMSAIAALLTLPFMFAASIQALMRSDLTLLIRSALGYLPLGLLAVSIAAPLTMLLLSASDELSGLIAGATGSAPASALGKFSFFAGGLGAVSKSTFIVFFVGLLTVAVTIILWIELLIRAAAVYVVVLMLPLFFAALVWPARRVWAIRAVELLVALILSKFTIVAVLSLGGAAIGHGLLPGITGSLAGATLVLLAACSPWALMRLLPMHELAGGLDGLRGQGRSLPLGGAEAATDRANEAAQAAQAALPSGGDGGADPDPSAARTAIQGLDRSAPVPGATGAQHHTDDISGGEPQVDHGGVEPQADDLIGAGSVAATAAGPGAQAAAASGHEPVASDSPAAAQPAERSPGLSADWQQPNWSAPTLVLGPDAPPTPPPPGSPESPGQPGQPGQPAQSEQPKSPEPAAQAHDLRPPAQEPDGGVL